MADQRVPEKGELLDPANGDKIHVVDVSDTTQHATGSSKWLSLLNFLTFLKSGLTKTDVGLSNVNNTADTAKPVSTAQQTALDLKVDKDGAKILSDENYTTLEKAKLLSIEDGAEVNTVEVSDISSLQADVDLKLPIGGIQSGALPTTPTANGWYTVAEMPSNTRCIGEFDVNTTSTGGEFQLMQIKAGIAFNGYSFLKVEKIQFSPAVDVIAIRILKGDLSTDGAKLQLKFQDTDVDTGLIYLKQFTGTSNNRWNLITPVLADTVTGYTVGAEITLTGDAASQQSNDLYVLNNKRVLNTDDLATVNTSLDGKAATSHTHTKGEVGLVNVDNTSDANKPVSTATSAAINALGKADVGLGNVDNTADIQKPVSIAQQNALDLKSSIGHTHSKSEVGLSNVDNTSDANKPISTATAAALSNKAAVSHTHDIADINLLQQKIDEFESRISALETPT